MSKEERESLKRDIISMFKKDHPLDRYRIVVLFDESSPIMRIELTDTISKLRYKKCFLEEDIESSVLYYKNFIRLLLDNIYEEFFE